MTACKHTVSGTISLPSRGAFHLSLTVLVHYRSAGIFSLTGWSPWIHARFHVTRATQVPARLPRLSSTGLSPSMARLSSALRLDARVHVAGPTTPVPVGTGLGYSLFARRYWGNRVFFIFLQVLRCFSSLGLLLNPYVFRVRYLHLITGNTNPTLLPELVIPVIEGGLPHSEIYGSTVVRTYP